MKKCFLLTSLCFLSLFTAAQNYEQQGDELFAQAQYEKAEKKYNAAIEISGTSSSLQTKKENCVKCASLLTSAKSAEQAATESSSAVKYEEASSLYSELYSLHPLSSYKSKATQLQSKADALRMEQEKAQQEEQARIARERQRADSIRQEAQKERERQEQIRRDEAKKRELLANSNITMKELLEHPLGIANLQWMDGRESIFEGIKKQLENDWKETVSSASWSGVKWHLYGGLVKELTLYYSISWVTVIWDESSKGVSVTYRISWRPPYDSRKQEQNKVFEYLKNEIEQYGILFTDSSYLRRGRDYYTHSIEMNNSMTYADIKWDSDHSSISLEIHYHLNASYRCTKEHYVKPGESLRQIAQKFGVSEEDILELNPKVREKGLEKYQTLFIPKQQNCTTPSGPTGASEESSSTKKSQSEIDIWDMNNTTPFNIIKWKVDYSSNVNDAWFSEKSGLTTDSRGWTSGMSESTGWYALHRFNRTQYTCNYLHSSNSLGRDGYGDNLGVEKAVRDRERNTLPIENGYYVLDLRDWQGYKPLYLPYSQEFLKSKWKRGMIRFEYR